MNSTSTYMNVSEMAPSTSLATHAATTVPEASTRGLTSLLTTLTRHAETTVVEVVTTAVPMHSDSTIIAVVIILVLLTVAGLGFLLYRYLCHNKGDYRTTGEPAPGEDPDNHSAQAATEKKEYFI